LYDDERGEVASRDLIAQGITEGYNENEIKKARLTVVAEANPTYSHSMIVKPSTRLLPDHSLQ
jgi:hypothetical protein